MTDAFQKSVQQIAGGRAGLTLSTVCQGRQRLRHSVEASRSHRCSLLSCSIIVSEKVEPAFKHCKPLAYAIYFAQEIRYRI